MDVFETLLQPVLVAAVGWLILHRIGQVEAKVDRCPTRDDVNPRLDRVETEVAALRSDITQVALAVGARTRR